MSGSATRATLTVLATILLTPAFLMMAINGNIRDPESSPAMAVLIMYLVIALYVLPATAIAGGAGAVLLQWFARKPGTLRGIVLTSAFATLLALAVAVLLSVASLGYVPLVQNTARYIVCAGVAGVIEASVLTWFATRQVAKKLSREENRGSAV
jgi:hypothetical protein